jgi:hypothetical protein
VYITVYQYVGRTLRSQIDDGSIGGGGTSDFTELTNVPSGLVSSSAQTIANLPSGTVSGSSQVDYTAISNVPSGIISGSSQVDYTSISNVPSGLVSGSSQISYNGITDIPSGIMSSSAQTLQNLVGQDLVVASITAEQFVVSSSVTFVTTSFSSGSTIFGDTLDDTHQFTGSLYVSGSIFFDEIDGGNF